MVKKSWAKIKRKPIGLIVTMAIAFSLVAFAVGLEVGSGTISSFFTQENDLEKISILSKTQQKAKTALAELLGKKIEPQQADNLGISNPDCDELESLKKAKQCTYLVMTNLGHGSAFAISDNFLITNKHVVEDALQIYTIIDQKEVELFLWNFAKDSDLAVLRSDQKLSSCNWADSDQILLAETLHAVGWPNTPEGESSVTRGIFSRLVKTNQGVVFIQTDTAINPGNSGGPLVSSCGVIGVNTAKISWSENNVPAEGFSFAITSNYAQQVASELIISGFRHDLPVRDIKPVEYGFVKEQPPDKQPQTQYILTEESRNNWLKAKDVTNEMSRYWQDQAGDVALNKLEELKDLIARMQAVLNIVLPKIEAQKPLTAAENDLLSSWIEMYQKAVGLEGELHNRDYSQGYAHLQCVGNSCALVSGRGQDQCSRAQDCAPQFHYRCQGMTCVVVEGEGEHQCTSHDDCYHYICQNKACVKVEGDGSDQCYFDWQCQ
jgi:S1-C subfamily serine protease